MKALVDRVNVLLPRLNIDQQITLRKDVLLEYVRAAAPDAELQELRVRREEAEWWHKGHICENWRDCEACKRLARYGAREKELKGK